MKLHKALKLRKKLTGEIAWLKQQIIEKNSYLEGSIKPDTFDTHEMYDNLKSKIDELVSLKIAINDTNQEIQSKIYTLSEYKALIKFWHEVPIKEGSQLSFNQTILEFKVQIDEVDRNKLIENYQSRVDAIQEEIDIYNYSTEISWGDE